MKFSVFAILMLVCVQAFAQSLVVDTKPKAPIQPTMWGLFFEDINYAADGGLYPELVKNRSFEFLMPLMGWTEEGTGRYSMNANSGSAEILNRGDGFESNPRFARVHVNAENRYALINEGFFGMGVKKDVRYDLSVWMRTAGNNIGVDAILIDEKGNSIGKTTVTADSKDWKKYTASIIPSVTSGSAKLKLSFRNTGVVDIDLVSLFPSDTWKGRPGGLRADLVQLLYDIKPGFLRFPGGCIVEGRTLAERYQWKKTVGSVEERELMVNRWNMEFKHRQSPDYYQSFGLGFFEYFQLAEDIGASPLPILGCGMACQFNSGELVPIDDLDPYVQDALDLIEFANGSVDSKWGKLRAAMGHPAPFNMTMIGVGNEQWGTQYVERYKIFEEAIKSKYPEITIISSAGPFPDGELFDYASAEMKQLKAAIIDEHYYKNPQWFFENATRYDSYDRNGPKIFAGEYAAQSVNTVSPDNKNTWLCALSEAAFMTGLERNADLVHLASYAPLFGHAQGWQWTPDLIWFDNLRSYATPNYHVQKLFGNHKGTHLISILDKSGKPLTGQDGLYASAVWDESGKKVILKFVNSSTSQKSVSIQLKGKKQRGTGTTWLLRGANDDVNSFSDPSKIVPTAVTGKIDLSAMKLEPNSFTVVEVDAR